MRRRAQARLEMLERRSGYRRQAALLAPYLTLSFLLFLSVGLGILHNRWRAHHRPDPILTGIRTLLYPVQYGAARLAGGWTMLWSGGKLARENARLRAEVARLTMENQNLQAAAAETVRLRAALDFAQRKGSTLVPAEVIGLPASSHADIITIARGARGGIREGMVVRTPEGLLGQVSEVSPFSSQVMLLNDASSGVSARVVRDGQVQGIGIVQGGGRDRPLQLEYLRQEDDIRPGDKVVSSGLGGVVSPDIPIGTVVSVADDKARALKAARVAPAAQGRRAREVFVLR